MRYKDVIGLVESVAPVHAQAEWDNSGLQVASSREEVSRLALFLDPTPQAIDKALTQGADCLLSHHPLVLKPRLPSRIDPLYKVLKILLAADVSLYAAHTSLDVNPDGPAGWLGRALNLQNRHVLESLPSFPGMGYGGIGDLPEAIRAKSFISQVLSLTRLKTAFLCGPPLLTEIRHPAWCGGSGASMVNLAARAGADIFITGDIKYHSALDTPIPILDVGHHSLEEEMMRRFAELLRKLIPQLSIIFIPSAPPFRMVVETGSSSNE